MANQKSNLLVCPHRGEPMARIKTSKRTVFLCRSCLADLEERLDKETIGLMIKSTMSAAEIMKLRHERENMRIQQALAESVAAAHAISGFPRWLALPAPAPAQALEVA